MAGRAAGSGSHYRVAVVDSKGKVRGEGVKLPSVTTILGKALPKGGLEWWGYKIACHAMTEAANDLPSSIADGDELYDLLKKRKKVTPYTELKKAGSRGTDVHNYAEALLRREGIDPDDVPEEQQGYVDALLKWYDEENVECVEPVAIEAPLFSLKHGFAGTCDLITKRGNDYWVEDFKTSKAVYDSHLIQLAAYEQAAKEMGLIPEGANVRKFVIRLGLDGEYELSESRYTIDDFLKVMSVYNLLEGAK